MDRNYITGMVLIFTVLLTYYTFFAPPPPPPEAKKPVATAAARAKSAEAAATDTTAKAAATDSVTAEERQKFGALAENLHGKDSSIVLENDQLRLTFSTKGGTIKTAELKQYKTWDKKPLLLLSPGKSTTRLSIPLLTGKTDLTDLYANALPIEKNGQGAQSIAFRVSAGAGRYIDQVYTLPAKGFLLNYTIKTSGLEGQLANAPAQLVLDDKIARLEKDINLSRTTATVNYYDAEGEFDNLGEAKLDEQTVSSAKPMKWVSLKQKFFNVGIIAGNRFDGANMRSVTNLNDSNDIKTLHAELNIPANDLKTGAAYTWYFGPNKYKTLIDVTDGYHKNVYLGYPVINLINRYVVVNVFHFLEGFISSYGIIIIILVLLLKTLLFPLSYRSYIGMARMKVLKPELDELKAQYGDDQQKIQAEQMKLYQQVGINPLSGCIPLLLQLPILFAMFNFFPNSVELRQESFLWAHDLSTYDSVFTLPFTVPFGYGSHVSLFTILMTASTLVLTWYNNQTSTVTGPMQYMGYVMPVGFMLILNTLPAGLNLYYLVSNVVSIVQQIIIRRFVDDTSIRRKLEETKAKNAVKPPKGGFMKRLEDAMKAAQEQKQNEDKGGKKKK
ncbi:MAG: membrane protein insertase YidC [Bacteroidota bacterium]